MKRNDLRHAQNMWDAADEVTRLTAGKSRSDLDDDPILAIALIKLLEIIGEAASHVNQDSRDDHPDIPWADIAPMGNRLAHACLDVNLDIVWKTVTEELPPVMGVLDTLVPHDQD